VIAVNGTVFDGVVVQTTKIVVAPGASAVVEVSTVVYVHPTPFVAASADVAKNVIAAAALQKNKDLVFSDPINPVEVKVRAWA
jgi:hypothetical protein